jgi:ATP-dependent phosphofructokinase / diphosphate-dependent phosphofructokinase
MKRVGIVIWWWDAPGLNAVTHAIVKSLPDCEIFGIMWWYQWLIEDDVIELTRNVTAQSRRQWWTILKTRNKGMFGFAAGAGDEIKLPVELVEAMKAWYERWKLDCLFVLGGDSTISTAQCFQEAGMNIIWIPKTIDNDLAATQFTYGFQTAIEIVHEAMQRLHTTATSHDRVMVVEVMGRHAGWIALYAGIAWWASLILLPEMPFSYDEIIRKLNERRDHWRHSSIIVVAEWAYEKDQWMITKDDGSKAAYKLLWWIGAEITAYLNKHTDFETRNNQLGHMQRWGSPSAMDMVLSIQYGAYAASMYRNGEFGRMVIYKDGEMSSVTIKEWTAHLKSVTENNQLYQLAKWMWISFG